jgi:hypothetical protein
MTTKAITLWKKFPEAIGFLGGWILSGPLIGLILKLAR